MKELAIDSKFRWRILSLFSHKKMAVPDFHAHPATRKVHSGPGGSFQKDRL